VPPFSDSPSGATLTVRVTPRAGRTALTSISNGQLLVRVAAAPVESAANEALVSLLAASLRLPRRTIRIVSGERNRTKRLLFAGCRAADLDARLASAVPEGDA
jgi:uncharacterized protein YggU (UPF0235/DUF167 family)